jgi:hypothetical protein
VEPPPDPDETTRTSITGGTWPGCARSRTRARQPGYGTRYLTGKFLLQRLFASRSRALGKDFTVKRFFAELDAAGLIPVSLISWQLTGQRTALGLP